MADDGGTGTFGLDESLANYPLPSLEHTLDVYLESAKPFLNPEELKETEGCVADFKANEGPKLQQVLEDRAKQHRNWIDDWWLEYAYHANTSPLVPGTNFGGAWMSPSHPLRAHFHKGVLDEDKRSTTAGIFLRYEIEAWMKIRREELPPNKTANGDPLTMFQMKSLYNSARVPVRGQSDRLSNHFKLVKEGKCPDHIVFGFRGQFYKVRPFEEDGQIWSPEKLVATVAQIERENSLGHKSIGVLTTLPRQDWAKARDHLKTMSPDVNAKILEEIESSILYVVLSDSEPETEEDLVRLAMAGCESHRDVFADKSWVRVVTKNGLYVSQSEHSGYDGMATIDPCTLVMTSAAKHRRSVATQPGPFERLDFVMDEKTKAEVERAAELLHARMDNYVCKLVTFDKFGRADIVDRLQSHPDAFVQMAIQVAALKTHGRPLATYETATARCFYRGRTETLRSCTPSATAFAKQMVSNPNDKKTLLGLYHEAVKCHTKLMKLCKQGRGCDRHLFGLAIAAKMTLGHTPKLFQDKGFELSGGNGNFTMSTSLGGFSTVTAGTSTPMIPDGYGVYYSIPKNQILMWINSFKNSSFSDQDGFTRNLLSALTDLFSTLSPE